MPRPDIAILGIKYRRIPLVAIGRDVYLDTRLIISKLEELYPPSAAYPALSIPTPEARAISHLFSKFWNNSGLFFRASQVILSSITAIDATYLADRMSLFGVREGEKSWLSEDVLLEERPNAIFDLQNAMSFLENTLLADGRTWILKTDAPSLSDLEAIWVFIWVINVPGALPHDVVSREIFPRVFAWIEKFSDIVEAKKSRVESQTLKGDEAAEVIFSAPYAEADTQVDSTDIVVISENFKEGEFVALSPTDYGTTCEDKGKLAGVTSSEFVLQICTHGGSVRLHAPRQGFRIHHAEILVLGPN
ncbi:hypothetical protein HDV64DRAFT_286426 [Trichoderma sp. TUCIM 5745]